MFWPQGRPSYVGKELQAVLSLADVRLVVADAKARDDRDESHSLVGLSVGWQLPQGWCQQVGDRQVCAGIGNGRNILPTTAWRVVVCHTMTAEQVATVLMPPVENFKLPDGTYPKPKG